MLAPICFESSLMKDTQNLRISLSDFPLGSKSAPPLPPPMFTMDRSQPRASQYIATRKLAAGESIFENLLKA